ncbi:MAG TPA: hypothetical protein VIK62_05250 [Verrucomicrobiae bacterium]
MLTKEQIAKLSVEDQEMLAKLELAKFQKHQLLLKQARGMNKSWRVIFAMTSAMILTFAGIYFVLEIRKHSPPNLMLAMLGVVILNFTALSYTFGINQRLDALVELLDEDGKLENLTGQSK